MKKSFLMLSVAVLAALVSCKKEETPADVLEIIAAPSETTIAKEGTDTPLSVTFKATKAWTASTDADFVSLTPKSGDPADECKVKINVAANETTADRAFTITLKSEGVEPVTLSFKQESQFHMAIDPLEVSVTTAGGEFTINVDANVEYSVTDYSDGSFPWQHAVPANDGKTVKVTIDANNTYDARTSYVKFKTSAIQEPVIDEGTGEPTGETQDLTIRVYFYQEGYVACAWKTDFTWDQYSTIGYSTALFGDYMLVNTSAGIQTFNKADGKYAGTIPFPEGIVFTGITNDDAGNLIASTGGNYPLAEGDPYEPLVVGYLTKGSELNNTNFNFLLGYYNGFYGYGLDNIRVTGDVTKDACVTMISAAGWDGGSSLVSWEVKDGAVAQDGDGLNPYTDYVGLPWTAAMWTSRHCVAKHLGTTVDSGVFCIGYDGNYNLHYNATMAGANWQEVFVTGSSWTEGYNAIDYIEWNGHKYAGFIGMTYFGKTDWDSGTEDWDYLPSYLFLVNIDDPTAPVLVSKQECYMTEGLFVYGSTTDINLEIEGEDLVAYVLDSGISCMLKVKYPKL